MNVCVWDWGWGVDGGWTPLPTRPQRYCDPASLVIGLHSLSSHFDIHLSIHPSAMLTLRIANECSGKEQDPVGKKSLFDFHGLSLEAKRHFTIPSTCNLLLFCLRKLNSFIHSFIHQMHGYPSRAGAGAGAAIGKATLGFGQG